MRRKFGSALTLSNNDNITKRDQQFQASSVRIKEKHVYEIVMVSFEKRQLR